MSKKKQQDAVVEVLYVVKSSIAGNGWSLQYGHTISRTDLERLISKSEIDNLVEIGRFEELKNDNTVVETG